MTNRGVPKRYLRRLKYTGVGWGSSKESMKEYENRDWYNNLTREFSLVTSHRSLGVKNVASGSC